MTEQSREDDDAQLGPFRLRRLLGEGSHGAVWLARQHSPGRDVALKLLRAAGAGPELHARFRREVELLASLEHPCIARHYESGSIDTPTGPAPYLAMEYVEGRDLVADAGARSLDLRARVQLLIELCRAVHYAHTRGVIHRDLKPANILVDAEGHPRIIDFGVASALDRADLTRMTHAGSIVGTFPYMSPEQLGGDSASDPRWDVYALGVIAYELLSGRLPRPELATQTSVVGAMKIVAERAPVALDRVLRSASGDLATVVMKALAESPGQRYGSAAEFADDLRRWLHGHPVEARPPSLSHLLRLFVRRHRALSAAVAASALVLLLATAVSVNFALSEAAARRDAETRLAERDAVNGFLSDMLRSADPEQGAGSDIRVREWLLSAEQGYLSKADALPVAVRQAFSHTLGLALLHLGESERALPRLQEAARLAADAHGNNAAETLASAISAARALAATGEVDPAIARLQSLSEQTADHPDARLQALALIALSTTLEGAGRIDESLDAAQRAYQRALPRLGADDPTTLDAEHNLAALTKHKGDFAAAEPLARDVHARRARLLGDAHPLTLYSYNQLGGVLDRLGRSDEATAIYRSTYAARRNSLGEHHPSTLVTLNNLTAALIQRGELEEAQPLVDQLLEATRARFGTDAPRTLMAMNQRAYVHEDLGQLDAAEAQLREIVGILLAQPGPAHPEQLAPRSNLAMLLSKRGKHDEAERVMQALLGDASTLLGNEHPYLGIFRSNFGEMLIAAGRTADARRELESAQSILQAKVGLDHPRTQKNLERLARLDAS